MIGNLVDVRCRASQTKWIDRKICRNNCKQWDNQKKKCKLKY